MFSIFARRCAGCSLRSNGRRFFADLLEESEEPLMNGSMRFEKSINQVNLLGRLGRDAELRGSEDHPVVVFSLATNTVYRKKDGETVSRVNWHRVSVFKPGLREKLAVHLKKGDRVFVTGSLRYDEYKDSNENMQRATTILANDIVNLTKRYLSEEEPDI
ncbi:single-stranded DNA-binding protein, mitochondrial-like [Gigantopelta aegis]|uniref:single-stranded DNA-binding protein, mitochondrial-like n=1 Tax=Gigantopelta aegis TaxID=1735272 RepID=UPI001B889290|nr:single-stranded DNA-binding protein, mitochondrial-like [Gigantopelta aegis]